MNGRGSTKAIIITAVLTFLVTSVLWIGIGAVGYYSMMQSPPGFEVTLVHPEEVTVGETFTLEVAISNPTAERLSLDSVDLYDELLDGFEIVSIDPKPNSKDHLFGYRSYYFEKKLQPSDHFEVVLELRAVTPGSWGGDIDCSTPFANFVTNYATIEVVAPTTESEADEQP